MAIRSSMVATLARFLLFLSVGMAACASSPPVRAARADFNGKWSVQWCDKTDPDAACGGFHVATGNTAILTIESLRSGGIHLVEATIEAPCRTQGQARISVAAMSS